jgi:O-antigen/teichoic acid export membrane protein
MSNYGNKMKKTGLINNIVSLMSGKIISQFISLIITIYLARKLEPENFGLLNFAFVIVTYFTLVSTFGLTTLGIKNLNYKKNNLFDEINSIISIRIVLSLITFILLIIVLLITDVDESTKILILILGISIFMEALNFNWVFNGLQEMKYISRATVIRTLIYGLALVLLFNFSSKKDIYLVGISTLFGIFSMVIYLIFRFKHRYKYTFHFKFDLKTLKTKMYQSSFFLLSGIFANINTNIDTVMIGFLRSNAEVGIYSSAYKIIAIFSLFIGFIYIPIFPKLVEYYSNEKQKELKIILNQLLKFIYFITLPIFIGGSLISKEIMNTIFGEKYNQGYFVFSLLLLFTVIFSIREVYGYSLVAWNSEKIYTKIVGLSSMYNILSNFILIPIFGITAAALNTVISEIINLILMKYNCDKIIRTKVEKRYYVKITLVSILMGIIVLIFKQYTIQIVIIIPIAITSYIILVFLFRIIDFNQIKKFFFEKTF